MDYCYKYPHPAVTADCIVFGFDGQRLRLLLVERGGEPYKGYWALPGGFMKIDESIEQCALRELREETNISDIYLEQFHVYSNPARDPRERVMTVAFIALVRPETYRVTAGDDAANVHWFDADALPVLAFDHRDIIKDARERLKEILRLKPVAFQLLNKEFSVDELRRVYEVINQTSYDRRNFQRKLLQSGSVIEVPETRNISENSSGRPAQMFRVNKDIVDESSVRKSEIIKPMTDACVHADDDICEPPSADLCLPTCDNAISAEEDSEIYESQSRNSSKRAKKSGSSRKSLGSSLKDLFQW